MQIDEMFYESFSKKTRFSIIDQQILLRKIPK